MAMHLDTSGELNFGLHFDAFERLVLVDAAGPPPCGRRAGSGISADRSRIAGSRSATPKDAKSRSSKMPAALPRARASPIWKKNSADACSCRAIERIVRVTGTDPTQWEVQTDRGPTMFLVKSDDEIRRFGPHKAMLIDAHGTRVCDRRRPRAWIMRSRRTLERYLIARPPAMQGEPRASATGGPSAGRPDCTDNLLSGCEATGGWEEPPPSRGNRINASCRFATRNAEFVYTGHPGASRRKVQNGFFV